MLEGRESREQDTSDFAYPLHVNTLKFYRLSNILIVCTNTRNHTTSDFEVINYVQVVISVEAHSRFRSIVFRIQNLVLITGFESSNCRELGCI